MSEARENIPVVITSLRRPVDNDGEIKMPPQRCIADTKNREQCCNYTPHGEFCWLHLALRKGVRVQSSSIAGAGKGLFAVRPLKRGEEFNYTGDLCNWIKSMHHHRHTVIICFEVSNHLAVDAARTNTAEGRFVNDARGTGMRNNLRFSVNQRAKTVKMKVMRNIKAGEELFVAYGKNYWKKDEDSSIVIGEGHEGKSGDSTTTAGQNQCEELHSSTVRFVYALHKVRIVVHRLRFSLACVSLVALLCCYPIFNQFSYQA